MESVCMINQRSFVKNAKDLPCVHMEDGKQCAKIAREVPYVNMATYGLSA